MKHLLFVSVALGIFSGTTISATAQTSAKSKAKRSNSHIAKKKSEKFIEKWWATPYRYGGATKDGIDCSAYSGTLVHDVYGTVLSRTARSQYQECDKIKKENLREGDLVFFKTRRGVSHVGVYLANGYFTHASTSSGVMISSLDEEYYSKRYIGGGRIAANTAQQ